MTAYRTAEQLYQEGRLDDAVAALSGTLKRDPSDTRSRTFLFELLCFSGAYDRAGKQLDALASSDPDTVLSCTGYQEALRAQAERLMMFESGRLPAREDAGGVSGTLNGSEFQDLRDADVRIGSRLEVIVGGRYTWIPFRHLKRVEIKPPSHLRDLFWAPATIEANEDLGGYAGDVLLPAITPLAWRHQDDAVRLGRTTEWVEEEGGVDIPDGQKLLLVDGEEFPLLEVRSLVVVATASP